MSEHTATNQELLPGHFVYINVYDEFYKIGDVEPFQYDTGQESTAVFSAVAASGTAGFKNVTQLDPDDKPRRHLFQILMGVQYNMRYYIKIPTGTNRFGTDETRSIGFLHPTISPFHAPNKDFQFWTVTDYYPSVDATNDASAETLTPKLRTLGFRYDLLELDRDTKEKLRQGMKAYKHITVGGLRC